MERKQLVERIGLLGGLALLAGIYFLPPSYQFWTNNLFIALLAASAAYKGAMQSKRPDSELYFKVLLYSVCLSGLGMLLYGSPSVDQDGQITDHGFNPTFDSAAGAGVRAFLRLSIGAVIGVYLASSVGRPFAPRENQQKNTPTTVKWIPLIACLVGLPVFVVLVLNFRPQSQPKSPVRAQPANAPPPALSANPPPQQAISKTPQASSESLEQRLKASVEATMPSSKRSLEHASIEELISLAEKGNIEAQFILGDNYFNGTKVLKNETEAYKWWFKAALQGEPASQGNIGTMLFDGTGVERDVPGALLWWRKAALQNNWIAQYNLGCAYEKGEGGVPNLTEAHKWYLESALNGYIDAQFIVAGMYRNGFGVAKDHAEAYAWYTVAAKAGDEEAADFVRNFERAVPPADMKRASRRAAKLLEQLSGQ